MEFLEYLYIILREIRNVILTLGLYYKPVFRKQIISVYILFPIFLKLLEWMGEGWIR